MEDNISNDLGPIKFDSSPNYIMHKFVDQDEMKILLDKLLWELRDLNAILRHGEK